MKCNYCTHFACRIAHARKEGAVRAAKQRERHGGMAPCTLEEIRAVKEAFAACLYNKVGKHGTETG
jgi:hypothetical protein